MTREASNLDLIKPSVQKVSKTDDLEAESLGYFSRIHLDRIGANCASKSIQAGLEYPYNCSVQAMQRLKKMAHNLEVVGSNPAPATFSPGYFSGRGYSARRLAFLVRLLDSLACRTGTCQSASEVKPVERSRRRQHGLFALFALFGRAILRVRLAAHFFIANLSISAKPINEIAI